MVFCAKILEKVEVEFFSMVSKIDDVNKKKKQEETRDKGKMKNKKGVENRTSLKGRAVGT
jgi:hypothetical protein